MPHDYEVSMNSALGLVWESEVKARIQSARKIQLEARGIVDSYPRAALSVNATVTLIEIDGKLDQAERDLSNSWFKVSDIDESVRLIIQEYRELAKKVADRALKTGEVQEGGGGASGGGASGEGGGSEGGDPNFPEPGESDGKGGKKSNEGMTWKSWILPVLIGGGIILLLRKKNR